jgi:hypothetical protein
MRFLIALMIIVHTMFLSFGSLIASIPANMLNLSFLPSDKWSRIRSVQFDHPMGEFRTNQSKAQGRQK